VKTHQRSIGKNDEWITPPEIKLPLGVFDLDPCSPVNRPWDTARIHYTIFDDGLIKPWVGRAWLNPPFNRYERPKWMKKMAEHNNGIMLIPAATETKAFAEHVWGKCAGILMLNKRPHFHYIDGSRANANSGCTLVLVAYGHDNFDLLRESGLGFPLVEVY